MKKRRLALMMALVMTFTSIDSSALLVSASDTVMEESISPETVEAEPVKNAGEEPAVQENAEEITPAAEVPEQAEPVQAGGTDVSEDTDVLPDAAGEETAPEITGEQMPAEAGDETVPGSNEETADGLPTEDAGEVPAEEEELIIGEEGIMDGSFEEAETADLLSALEEGTADSTEITPLELDTDYTVSITDPQSPVWYSFTAPEAGDYTLLSDYSQDQYLVTYQHDDPNNLNYYTASENIDEVERVAHRVSLAENEICYFRATATAAGDYTACIVRTPQVASISVVPYKNVYIAGMESLQIWQDIKTFTYTDGTSSSALYFYEGSYIDIYGNRISGTAYAGGDKQRPYYNGEWLPVGEYVVEYTCGEISVSYNFSAVDVMDTDQYKGTLTEGEDISVFSPAEQYAYYSFEPSKSGTYSIEKADYVCVYEKTEDGYNDAQVSGPSQYKLSAGKTYYIGFRSYMDTEERIISIKCIPTLASVEISGTPEIWSWSLGSRKGVLNGATVTFKYEDGTSQEVTVGNSIFSGVYDSYGHGVGAEAKADGQDETVYNEDGLQPGDYTVIVYIYGAGVVVGQYTLKVSNINVGERALVLGENTGLTAGDGCTYYKFVPEKSGNYHFKGAMQDLGLLVRSEMTPSGYEQCNWSTGDPGTEFKGVFDAGREYYVGLQNVDADFVLTICYTPAIQSIQAVPARDTYIADYYYSNVFDNLSLTLEYGEGIPSETIKFEDSDYANSDSYGNWIFADMYDAEDKQESSWGEHAAGTYTVKLRCDGELLASYPVYVKPFSEVETKILSLGGQKVTAGASGVEEIFYKLTVTEGGGYRFNFEETDYVDYDSIDMRCYTLEGDTLTQFYGTNNTISLEAGKPYYIQFVRLAALENIDLNLSIEKLPEATGIELLNMPENLQFIEKVEDMSLDGTQAEITDSTGKTTGVTLAWPYDSVFVDSFGCSLEYKVYRAGAEEEPYDDISVPGDYFFRISCGDFTKDVPFRVISLEEACQGTLAVGQSSVLKPERCKALYKFQTENAAVYQIQFNAPVEEVVIADSGSIVSRVQMTDYRTPVSLETPGTYYLYVKAAERYRELEVEVTEQTDIKAIDLEVLKKDYIAGLEIFDGRKIKAKVTYSDDTVSTLKEGGDIQGRKLCYRVQKKDPQSGELSSEVYGEALETGTYTVTPYLISESLDCVIETEIPGAPTATVQGVRLDVSSIPVILQDTVQKISYGYRRTMYSFTAAEEGTYEVQQSEGADSCFYYDEETGLREAGRSISLEQGQTCVLVCNSRTAGEICVRKLDKTDDPRPDNPDPTKPVVLEPDQKVRINFTGSGMIRECTFTPSEDGRYNFSSEGSMDPKVELYCDGECLTENDDGPADCNFSLSYHLKAGKTYTYKIGLWDGKGSFSVLLKKMSEKEITKVEIVGDDAEYTMFRSYDDIFQLQITYDDGTKATEQIYLSEDIYGNRFSSDYQRNGDGGKIVVSYGKEGADPSDWKQTSRAIKRREFADLEKIAADGSVTFTAALAPDGWKEWDYAFTPQETGEYAWSCAHSEDISCRYEVMQVEGSGVDIDYWVLRTDYVNDEESSVWMTAGKRYAIRVYAGASAENAESVKTPVTVSNRKIKTLTGLSVTEQPAETTVTDGLETAALDGIQVKAVYADGSEELLTIGQRDSQGRELSAGAGYKVKDNRYRQEIRLGTLVTSVYLTINSSKDLPVLTEGQDTVMGGRNDYRFTPEKTGAYQFAFSGEAPTGITVFCEADEEHLTGPYGYYYMEAGKTYLVAIRGAAASNAVRPVHADCEWITTEKKDATCEEAGLLKETCKIHGETRETVLPAPGHDLSEWRITAAADCETDGQRERGCSRCDFKETEKISASGHAWSEWKETAATCTEDGEKTRTCGNCQKSEKEILKATGHDFSGELLRTEPGETENGKTYYLCLNGCGTEKIVEILLCEADRQNIETAKTSVQQLEELVNNAAEGEQDAVIAENKAAINDAAARITEIDNENLIAGGGMDTVAKTEDLVVRANENVGRTLTDNTLEDQELQEITVEGAALTALKATEGESADTALAAKITVSRSENDYSELAPVTHAVDITLSIVNAETKEVVDTNVEPAAPLRITIAIPQALRGKAELKLIHMDGTAGGTELPFTVSADGASITFVTPSLSDMVLLVEDCGEGRHESGDSTVITEADCLNPGEKTFDCSVCGRKIKEEIPALGHEYTREISVTEADCLTDGKRIMQCIRCDSRQETVIPATGGHQYKWITDKKATCGAAGKKHQECTVCGAKQAAVDIKATGAHKYGGWTVTKKATVLATGTKKQTCTVCKKATKTETIAKLPAKIALTANSLAMKVKQSTTRFKVTQMAAGDYLKSVVSSDTKLLKVSGVNRNGSVKLTAQKKTGKVNLKFTLASGKSKTITVTIQKGAVKTTSITGVQKNITVKQGKTVKLAPSLLPVTSVEKISYKTSNKKVATVSSKGVVKGVKGGTAKIYVKAGKKTFTCTVKVEGVKTTGLKNVPAKLSLKTKKSYTLKPKRVPAASADAISYSSSNKKVATVTAKGKITAKSKGTAVITVKCGKAVVRCTVTVK